MRKTVLKAVVAVWILSLVIPCFTFAAEITFYFAPTWKENAPKAKMIAETLSNASGLAIQPRIADTYPEIIDAFSKGQPLLTYAGSFVQAILYQQNFCVPLLQGIDGKELYTGVLIAPKAAGSDPVKIVKEAGEAIAFAKAASSGESAAMAATGGKAEVAAKSHAAAVNAVKAGKAKCAFVKDWWWEENKDKYEDMAKLDYPGVSNLKNPDNVLSSSKSVPAELAAKIKGAALGNAALFGVKEFKEMNPALLEPSLALMKKGKIDPKSYKW
jgi:ABC-type phosphate/phosphonate transport system substrate-binding protein